MGQYHFSVIWRLQCFTKLINLYCYTKKFYIFTCFSKISSFERMAPKSSKFPISFSMVEDCILYCVHPMTFIRLPSKKGRTARKLINTAGQWDTITGSEINDEWPYVKGMAIWVDLWITCWLFSWSLKTLLQCYRSFKNLNPHITNVKFEH